MVITAQFISIIYTISIYISKKSLEMSFQTGNSHFQQEASSNVLYKISSILPVSIDELRSLPLHLTHSELLSLPEVLSNGAAGPDYASPSHLGPISLTRNDTFASHSSQNQIDYLDQIGHFGQMQYSAQPRPEPDPDLSQYEGLSAQRFNLQQNLDLEGENATRPLLEERFDIAESSYAPGIASSTQVIPDWSHINDLAGISSSALNSEPEYPTDFFYLENSIQANLNSNEPSQVLESGSLFSPTSFGNDITCAEQLDAIDDLLSEVPDTNYLPPMPQGPGDAGMSLITSESLVAPPQTLPDEGSSSSSRSVQVISTPWSQNNKSHTLNRLDRVPEITEHIAGAIYYGPCSYTWDWPRRVSPLPNAKVARYTY